MKKFKIYGFTSIGNPVLITNSENLSFAATFDEKMTLQENMKATLSFNIADTLETGETNPFMGLVYPGAKIRLDLWQNIDNSSKFIQYDFLISTMSSEFYKKIIIYSVTAEDYASSIYSKEGQGLNLDKTGTLRELVQEILVLTRKNLGYRNFSINYLNLNNYTGKSANVVLTGTSLKNTYSGAATAYVDIPVDKNIQISTTYSLVMNVLELPASLNTTIQLKQLDISNNEIVSQTVNVIKDGTFTGLIVLDFNILSTSKKFRIEFISSGTGTIVSVSDFKINIKKLQLSSIYNYLHIAGDSPNDTSTFNEENFRGSIYEQSTSYYKKVTLSLSNSNLYNGLIEIAKLFNAEIIFNYSESTINFKNKDLEYNYKGYRLSPEFNLLTLSREEDFNEFNSVITVNSNNYVSSIFPTMPSEFKQYLLDCITNGFSDEAHFNLNTYNEYGKSIGYQTVAEYVKTSYISNTENRAEREKLINDFAIAADKVPNLENTIYNLDYYDQTNKISLQEVQNFKSIIHNDLRKVNIKLKLFSELYLNISSDLSSRNEEIDFITRNLTVERIRLNDIDAIIPTVTGNVLTSYQSLRTQTVNTIISYMEQLLDAYSISYTYTSTSDPEDYFVLNTTTYNSNSYVYLIMNYLGFTNNSINGIVDKINEINTKITELTNLKNEQLNRIAAIDVLLAGSLSNYRKTELQVERAGLQSLVDDSIYTIGSASIDGMYDYQLTYLNFILSKLSTLTIPVFDGLYNLLYNEYYTGNINIQKQNIIRDLYDSYERYIIEGYYDNQDEVTSSGLLEQALLSFELSKYPKINYGVSIIDISALANYQYIDLIIGDKILIQEVSNRLFKVYSTGREQIIDIDPPLYTFYGVEKYLQVSQIGYDLRKPEATSLTVAQEDQTKRILQKLILNIAGL